MSITPSRDPNQMLAEADRLLDQGRADDAEAIYRQLLAAYPGQPGLMHRLALVLKGRGAFSEAESVLRRALIAAPGEAILHNNLGSVLRAAGRSGDAEGVYQKAIAINPSYAEAHYNLGVTLEDLARPDDALASYRRALAVRPDYGAAQIRVGAILREQQQFDGALQSFDAALLNDPQSFEAHYHRGLTLANLERFSDAIEALTTASALRPSSTDSVLALANNLKNADRNDEALSAFWRAMELQPLQISTHDELNRLAWTAGRTDIFLKSFQYARERHGDDPGLLFAEAQMRTQRNEPQRAESLLRRALEIDPVRADANALLGRILARRKRYDESFEAFSNAVRLAPAFAAFRNEFGYALLQGREEKRALDQFGEARRMNPSDQLALGGICLAYRALGDSRYGELANMGEFVRVYPLRLPAGYADAAGFNAALAEELARMHTMTSEPLEQTLRGGTQTPGLLFTRNSKMVQLVRDLIAEAVSDYIGQMSAHTTHPLLSRKQAEFSFTHSWSCKLRSSGFHTNHVHPMGWISSAYYVSLPDELENESARPGWLKFGESYLELGDGDRPEHFVKPMVGQLALFPSYFWHGTVPFESTRDRLTIAFDVVPGVVDPRTIAAGPY